MASPLRFLFVDGVVSAPADTPPVTTLLASQPGAYTTTRTHNNGSVLLFWERHLSRLANSARILINSNPKLLFKPGKTLVSVSMNSSQFSIRDSMVESLVNDSMRRALPVCLKERTGGEELAITALVSGNHEDLSGREGVDDEKILKSFNVYIHVGVYVPLVFGRRENGAHLAVVGHGRDVANAKYSDWVR